MADQRLIDANALDKMLVQEYLMYNDVANTLTLAGTQVYNAAIDTARCKIREAYTIDAAPVVHGRWEWFEDWGVMPTSILAPQYPPEIFDYGWRCSCCKTYLGEAVDVSNAFDDPDEEPVVEHCPNCGARMDAKE